jgi:hypothetical protein
MNLRFMNPKGAGDARWGTSISDFRVGSTTRGPGRTKKNTKKNTKQTTKIQNLRNRRPATLARSLDELQTFANHVTQLCDSEDGIADTVIIDSDEEDDDSYGETDTVEMERAAARGALTLSPDDVQAFLDLVNQIGPTPSIESRKFVNGYTIYDKQNSD